MTDLLPEELRWRVRRSKWLSTLIDAAGGYTRHSMSVYSASVSFWAIISLVPLLAMVVFAVALFSEPEALDTFLDEVSTSIPGATMEMITTQIRTWAQVSVQFGTVGLVIAVCVAGWGASSGVSHMIRAINVAHERAGRSFAERRIEALLRTITALLVIVPIVTLVAATPTTLNSADIDGITGLVISVVRWPIVLVLFVTLLSGLYWIAPTPRTKFRIVTPGVAVAAVLFIVLSAGFSIYASNVDKYDVNYGSLATIIVTMLWTYLSISSILFGAEIDAARHRASLRSE